MEKLDEFSSSSVENDELAPHFAKSRRRRVCCCFSLAVLLGVGALIFVALEMHMPVLPPPTEIPTLPPSTGSPFHVRSHDLHPHVLQHRQGFVLNSHVQMMDKVQTKLNLSNCWLCTQLPQAAEQGFMTYAQPLPLNTSCLVLFSALFYRGGEFYHFDVSVLAPMEMSVLSPSTWKTRRELLLSNNLHRIPYSDLIQTKWTDKTRPPFFDLRRECTASLDIHNRCPVPINTHILQNPVLCFSKRGTAFMGQSTGCPCTLNVTRFVSADMFAGRSVYFICGHTAYLWLPANWAGTCYIALLLPDVLPVQTKDLHLLRQMTRDRRSITPGDLIKGLFPWYGVISNSKAIRELATLFEEAVNTTAHALEELTLETRAIRLVALQNRMGLDIIFAESGGLCERIGVSCCSFIPDLTSSIQHSINKLHVIGFNLSSLRKDQSGNIQSWFSGVWYSWGWKLVSILLGGLAGLVFLCCILNFLPVLCSRCSKALLPPSSPTQIMLMTGPSHLVYVAGYGLLPRITDVRPTLDIRHLYDLALVSSIPPAENSAQYQVPIPKQYVLKSDVHALGLSSYSE